MSSAALKQVAALLSIATLPTPFIHDISSAARDPEGPLQISSLEDLWTKIPPPYLRDICLVQGASFQILQL